MKENYYQLNAKKATEKRAFLKTTQPQNWFYKYFPRFIK
jgi:hypothetical protein